MAKQRSKAIPDEEWERHKWEIVSLYRSATLQRVMQLMSQRHGFHASKNQYTQMLKTWDIRKNSNSETWKRIYRCYRKRQMEGKASDYFLYGNNISQDELEKKFKKYVSYTERLYAAEDSDASIPDGFTVLTPPANTVFTPHDRVIRIDNLPWILFNHDIRSKLILWQSLSDSATSMATEYSDVSAHQIYCQGLESLEASHVQQSIAPSSTYPSISDFDIMTVNLDSMFDPFLSFESSCINASLNPLLVGPELPASLAAILREATTFYYSIPMKSFYQTYIVEDNQDDSYTALSVDIHSSPTVFRLFNLFIFIATNNLLYGHFIREVYEWAYSNSCSWIFTEILKMRSTTINVFATKLLPAAVQVGDIEMVRNIVSRNVDVDTPTESLWRGRHPRTALSLAVGERNKQMINLLCDLGATRKIIETDTWADNRKRIASLWSPESIQILRSLLDHGADPECFVSDRPRGFPLVAAASRGNLEAVSLLIAAKATVNWSIPEQKGTALQAAAAGGHVQVVRALLNANADANMVHIVDTQYDVYAFHSGVYYGLNTPIQLAARADNTEIAMLLLQSGALVNFCPMFTARGLEWLDHELASRVEFSRSIGEELPFAFAIQYAAQNGNVPLVHHLLAAGAMVDSRIGVEHGDTPLQLAARMGHVEMVSLLLASKADVNAPAGKYNGRTAIQAAAESGNIKIIQMLLDADADVNASPGWTRGRTALQAALEKGHINAARRLLLAGAYINADPGFSQGLSGLQAAVSFGDIEIVREVLSYEADVNAAASPEWGFTALQVAVKHESIDLLILLLQKGADVDALPSKFKNKTALQYAVYLDWIEGVQLLLRYNPDVRMLPPYEDDLDALSALGWAIENNNHDMMVLLLDHGAGPNDPVMNSQDAAPTAFLKALSLLNSYESIEAFVKRGADIFQCWDSETALDLAVFPIHVNVKIVRMIIDLISQAATGNHFDASFRNSLAHITVDDDLPADIELIQLLLDAGADIDAQDGGFGMTILQSSARHGSVEVIEFLLQHGAEVNIPATEDRGTPLQEAINWYGQTEIAGLLLKHGADVNAPPAKERGVTALQAAAIHGYVPLARKLLEHGADVAAAASPNNGRTAIDGAAEHGHLDMLQLLLNAYGEREGLASVCNQAASFAEKEGHAAIAVWLRGYATS